MAHTDTPHIIVGVHITDRVTHASRVQAVLTEYGCNIKTRLGLHDVESNSTNGLLLIEFIGGVDKADEMIARLDAIDGVEAQKMFFEH